MRLINLFSRKLKKNIGKSVEKYNKFLLDDVNLLIRTRYNGRLYTSYVEKIDDEEITFRCPIDDYELIRFRENNIIRVELISYTGLYITELLIKEKIVKDNMVYYKAEINSAIEKKQRRKNERLSIVLELEYTILPRENQKYKGNSIDISTGGMLMEAYEDIYQSKDIRVNIDLDGKKYSIKSTIINKRVNYRNGAYLYNLRFNNLSNRKRGEIYRFVFDNKKVQANKAFY